MPPRRKKLIEVALPLEAINKESAREKSIRHGHPSTLHLWWARRPLAACRAVLFAQFVDDPDSDPAYRRADGSVDEQAAGTKRAQLFNLIEELVKWENSNNDRVINAARAEIARCVASRLIEEGKLKKETVIWSQEPGEEGQPHPKGPLSGEFRTAWELVVHGHGDLDSLQQRRTRLCPPAVVNHFLATYAPPVLDPFAGGGSIPLEAQRLGLRAYASDLNPVPVLINKALIEIPPKFANLPPVNPEWQSKSPQERAASTWSGAQGLAEDVRYYGKWMRDEAEKRIGHLYPQVTVTEDLVQDRTDLARYTNTTLTVIAWLWARTVTCSNPACGADTPLVSSFAVSKNGKRNVWFEPTTDHSTSPPTVHYAVKVGPDSPPPPPKLGRGAKFKCVVCDTPMDIEYLRREGRSGNIRCRLTTIIAEGDHEQVFLSPVSQHESVALRASGGWHPELELPDGARYMTPTLYGLATQADLYTARQLLALTTFSDLVKDVEKTILQTSQRGGLSPSGPLEEGGAGSNAYAQAVAAYLACAVGRCADYWSSLTIWARTFVAHTFGRNALSMVWDFPEANPFSCSTGNWAGAIDWIARVLERVPAHGCGTAKQLDARVHQSDPCVFSTDPPYYDNVPYADLSDYFYVWLRRSVNTVFPLLTSTMATPKTEELVADSRRQGGTRAAAEYFEHGMREVFRRFRNEQVNGVPLTVYYAFKQAETAADAKGNAGTASTGWEAMLSGLIESGLAVNGTWPLRTERPGRLRETASNALASSIVLTCVPRGRDASMATRREFVAALKRELPEAMKKLQSGNIAPVDLAQAAIGPGMAVFSRYSKVIESDGEAMTVRAALTLINQILDEVLAEQEGEFDGDTRWAVSWFETHGVQDGPYGVAETLSKAKNTSVQGLVEAGVITARGGKVKLIARDDMPDDWDPATDKRATCWEATQHLIRRLQNDGEEAAAELLRRLGGDYGEMARDLAYRLYSVCERKGWAQEALAYNSLVIAWSEISKLSRSVTETKPAQADLFSE